MAAPAAMRRCVKCVCGHSGEVALPIRARLQCTSCGQVQIFGEQSRGSRSRERRQIVGVVRFKRPAPAADREHVDVDFDDDVDDLFRSE
jgi:hypothetical protein